MAFNYDTWASSWGNSWANTWGVRGVVEDVIEGGGTTLSPRRRRTRQEELDWQRSYARSREAALAAKEITELPKAEAKRRIRRVYKVVSQITEPPPDLIDSIAVFAPRLAKGLELPPEKAIKFDVLAREQQAIEMLYEIYLAEIERTQTLEIEAATALLMVS